MSFSLIKPTNLPGIDFPHQSNALKRNKIARVVIPEKPAPKEGWPVCYILHSFGGDRFSWLQHIGPAINSHSQSYILVFPECGRRWFINDVAGNNYEDYLVQDLLPAIDTHFSTQLNSSIRAIGGFSMGGASAIFMALKYPDLFSTVFSIAGAFRAADRIGDPYTAFRKQDCVMPTEEEHLRVWGDINSEPRIKYKLENVIQAAALKSQHPKIILEVGKNDYLRVVEMNKDAHQLLLNASIKHQYAEYPGDHSWTYAVNALSRIFPILNI